MSNVDEERREQETQDARASVTAHLTNLYRLLGDEQSVGEALHSIERSAHGNYISDTRTPVIRREFLGGTELLSAWDVEDMTQDNFDAAVALIERVLQANGSPVYVNEESPEFIERLTLVDEASCRDQLEDLRASS